MSQGDSRLSPGTFQEVQGRLEASRNSPGTSSRLLRMIAATFKKIAKFSLRIHLRRRMRRRRKGRKDQEEQEEQEEQEVEVFLCGWPGFGYFR